jgi:hypothetical protein
MTQTELDCAVALATRESLHTVRALGFGLVTRDPDDLEPEDLRLVVDCPFCRLPVPFGGRTRDGSLPLGECEPCDVYFDVKPDEIYAASAGADRRPPDAS